FVSLLNLYICFVLQTSQTNGGTQNPKNLDVLCLCWNGYVVSCRAVCSAIFHACDCWFTEYLDYFSAFAFILSASFVSFCFTLPWLSGVLSQTRITTVYGLLLVIWYLKHVFSMMQHFDYGYNMFCCIGVSLLTSMMYLFYILVRRRLLGRFSKSDRVLLLILVWTNGSVLLETFDFAPIFWIFDAHSLFHAATIPLPLFTRIFLREYVSENIYQLDKTV
ncbi:Per1-like protein, partial [Oesophagostomum dentatum]